MTVPDGGFPLLRKPGAEKLFFELIFKRLLESSKFPQSAKLLRDGLRQEG